MKQKNYLILGIILVLVTIGIIFITHQIKSRSFCTAVIDGWLFEINTPQGTQKFLVRQIQTTYKKPSILNESEIMVLTRTHSLPTPVDMLTYEAAQSVSIWVPYENYEKLILDYLNENNIQGKIVNKYVVYFPVACSR